MIKIENLRKVYDTGLIKFEALKGVNFTLSDGNLKKFSLIWS